MAFFSKQYFIAPAAACTLYLLVRSPRRGLLHGAFTAGLLAGGLALSVALWGSGFFFSVFEAVRNPIEWGQFRAEWASMLQQPGFVVLLTLAAVSLGHAVARHRLRLLADSPFPTWVATSFVMVLATVGKVGSSTNYFFECSLAVLLWLAFDARSSTRRPRALMISVAAIVAAAAIELVGTSAADIAFTTASVAQEKDLSMRRAGAAILANGPPRPKILNLSEARNSYPLPGEIWLSDPFQYRLLWASGQLSSAPVVDVLRTKGVDGVLALRGSVDATMRRRLSPILRFIAVKKSLGD